MARKVLNRKELRAETEAADKAGEKSVKPKDTAAKKQTKQPKARSKDTKEVRMRAYWGVFNQSLKRVALFDHCDRKAADKKAAELSQSGKSPHFVQPVKEIIEE
ncbi:MAG: hypothetical protein A2W31_04650 [Planctomycetes bacterium RBG_16_64_10]|nr:MAG: hypothetical protein A2W31_04650 [Planctomycetes bacterium RBG_16_64_10]